MAHQRKKGVVPQRGPTKAKGGKSVRSFAGLSDLITKRKTRPKTRVLSPCWTTRRGGKYWETKSRQQGGRLENQEKRNIADPSHKKAEERVAVQKKTETTRAPG